MARQFAVSVRPDGTIAVTTRGIKGPACLDEVARIEALTGARTTTSALTEEYHQAETAPDVVVQEEVQRGDLG